jgi:hypothetical protein
MHEGNGRKRPGQFDRFLDRRPISGRAARCAAMRSTISSSRASAVAIKVTAASVADASR